MLFVNSFIKAFFIITFFIYSILIIVIIVTPLYFLWDTNQNFINLLKFDV